MIENRPQRGALGTHRMHEARLKDDGDRVSCKQEQVSRCRVEGHGRDSPRTSLHIHTQTQDGSSTEDCRDM